MEENMSTINATSAPEDVRRYIGAFGRPKAQSATIFIPFDIGESYLFNVKHKRSTPSEEWSRIFQDEGDVPAWNCCQQFPDRFHKPLGWCSSFSLGDHSAASVIQKDYPVSGDRYEGTRVVVFPLGIAVLVLRTPITLPIDAFRSKCWNLLEKHSSSCESLAASAAESYCRAMKRATRLQLGLRDTRTVVRLRSLDRSRGILKPDYIFPLFFLKSAPPDFPLTDAKAYPRVQYGKAEVCTGWTEAFALGSTRDEAAIIEANFTIAMASWYALAVMNRLANHYLSTAVFASATNRPHSGKVKSRIIRLTYMEGANSSRPIRWTTEEDDLRLLESIHNRWSTHLWWENVEERTTLLALHYEQLAAEEEDRRGLKFAVFGSVIACFTLVSAVVDGRTLFPATSVTKEFLDADGIWLPLVLAFLFAIWYLWPKLRERMPIS
jgi:hypothetical protein